MSFYGEFVEEQELKLCGVHIWIETIKTAMLVNF